MLSNLEITRYSRNMLLQGVGKKGQIQLKNSIVSIIGAGGLGSVVSLYLAAGGVGEIRIFDSDTLDLTNLQRQILYDTDDIGRAKSQLSRDRLRALNPEINIREMEVRITKENIGEFLQSSHLVLEGSDNFETKFLVNDYCVLNSIPLIIAGILRFEGQVLGIQKNTPCYRCTFLEPPEADSVPNCAEAGVLGSVAGVVGSIQASEALKYLLFGTSELFGKILFCNLLTMDFRKIERQKNKNCPLCGINPIYQDLSHHHTEMGSCDL